MTDNSGRDGFQTVSAKTTIISSDKNRIEGEAILQLEKTAELPGMVKAVGLPDLHPGKGHPVGAAFISRDVFYPYLVGNDIGCGMSLWVTDLQAKKMKPEKWLKKLDELESEWDGDYQSFLQNKNVTATNYDSSLGTIGGGNHFAELQKIEQVIDEEVFKELNMDKDILYLLVHSGSRGLGESILRKHIDKFAAAGLTDGTPEAEEYLAKHDHAISWARVNRDLIAQRFLSKINADRNAVKLFDICHNSVTRVTYQDKPSWLHRKGSTPSVEGPVVIPGSRGSYSYLVVPAGEQENNAFSLPHGAGRKWGRGDTKSRLSHKYKPDDLKKTDLGSYVICENKDLLYEEAPQAYKNIDQIISDIASAGLVKVVAVLRPVITYKTRRV